MKEFEEILLALIRLISFRPSKKRKIFEKYSSVVERISLVSYFNANSTSYCYIVK